MLITSSKQLREVKFCSTKSHWMVYCRCICIKLPIDSLSDIDSLSYDAEFVNNSGRLQTYIVVTSS